jgi:hypothetical protein
MLIAASPACDRPATPSNAVRPVDPSVSPPSASPEGAPAAERRRGVLLPRQVAAGAVDSLADHAGGAGDVEATATGGIVPGRSEAGDRGVGVDGGLRFGNASAPSRQGENPPSLPGIRVVTGNHLALYTDLPSDANIDDFPLAFDQAVPQWCRYFGIPPSRAATWRLTGYLIKDRPRFRAAGLLPDDLPPFVHGYQRGSRLWLYDQPSNYYRRHLLLHEGTHGFAHRFLGGVGPTWYAEGVAELLATHRWHDGQLTLGYFPAGKEEVPHWGRIKIVRDEVAARRGLTIGHITRPTAWAQLNTATYAWCWAVAALLDNHPRYQLRFRQLAQQLRAPRDEFTRRFDGLWASERRELEEEWQLFAVNLQYGYDVPRAAVQYAPGQRLPAEGAQVDVAADRGWQSTGIRLEANNVYRITATGRYQIAQEPQTWWCEPDGVTIRYWRGQPLGRLLGQVRPDQAAPGLTPLARPVAIGSSGTLRPDQTGTLYLVVNDSPAELSDNAGKVLVKIEPSRDG